MRLEQIIDKVNEILVEEFEIEASEVVPEARLREDLDMDSLDGVDLVVALETAFGIQIDEKVVTETKTLGDMHAYVRTLYEAKDKGE